MMATKRVVIFGGQGSTSLFSAATSQSIQQIVAESTAASVLLSKCHAVFLETLMSLEDNDRLLAAIDAQHFQTPKDLLVPQPQYHNHGIIEGTSLCLYQLISYVHQAQQSDSDITSSLESILETTGFCAGLIPAIVVASSRTINDYISHGVEAFHLSFWIACRATLACRNVANARDLSSPWSLVVPEKEVPSVKRAFTSPSMVQAKSLHISAVSAGSISLSGSPADLAAFKAKLPEKSISRFANIHAWYHGGERLHDALCQVEADIANHNVAFVSTTKLFKPLRSTVDGTLLRASDDNIRLDLWVARHILVDCVNWSTTFDTIFEMASQTLKDNADLKLSIDSFGPSTGYLFESMNSRQVPSSLVVKDRSVFKYGAAGVISGTQGDGIAIVGMGLNLPSGNSPEDLWAALSAGLDFVQEVPRDRFDLDSRNADSRARHGAFINGVWNFDHTYFSISPREASSMDPQQRILLHTTQAALDDAGYVPDSTASFQRKSMGCYIGIATGDYAEELQDDIDVYYSTGNLRAFHSGRIAYAYKLSGPCVTTDTACSSSMVAIHQACRALQAGDCTSAIAGGANVVCSPNMFLGLDRGHFLSSTGGCKPFDESADGYCRAEGCVVFVLKKLHDAILEGDRIYGIIKDSVVNQSGNARSITHPDSETQVQLIQSLLEKTNVSPSSIDVVEAHGTGTQAGDSCETSSLQRIFADYHSTSQPLMISSIKGNIGHCEAASGAAGLAKLILMMEKEQIPRQVGLRRLNPRVTGLADDRLRVPEVNSPWKRRGSTPRLALLNNFGAAGSNGALILEEHAQGMKTDSASMDRSSYMFLLSAKTKSHLQDSVGEFRSLLAKRNDLSLRDVCYTVSARRQLYDHRIALACDSLDSLQRELGHTESSQPKPASHTVFVFSGQGSSYLGMGKELMSSSLAFKQDILRCNEIVESVGCFGLLDYFDGKVKVDSSSANEAIISQCACVALEYALARLFISWNITPDYVVGHSLGEYAALAISGILSLEDVLATATIRAKMMTEYCDPHTSGMTACEIAPSSADSLLRSNEPFSGLSVACRNSLASCVVSGPISQLSSFEAECSTRGIKFKRLDVPYGFHSSAMDPLLQPLKQAVESVRWSNPTIPCYSTVFGRCINPSTDLTSDYFPLHAREPVLFVEAIQSLNSKGIFKNAVCLEIGPHPITIPLLKSIVSSTNPECMPALRRGKEAWDILTSTLCRLATTVGDINWRQVFDSSGAKLVTLPGHPLRGQDFRITPPERSNSNSPRRTENTTEQPKSSPSPSPFIDTACELLPKMQRQGNMVIFETSTRILGTFIIGHNVGGVCICPASVYMELAMQGAGLMIDSVGTQLVAARDVKFEKSLIHEPSAASKAVYVRMSKNESEEHIAFQIASSKISVPGDNLYCSGIITTESAEALKRRWKKDSAIAKRQMDQLQNEQPHRLSRFAKKVLYDVIFPRVVQYSEPYQSLADLYVSESMSEGVGEFNVPRKTWDNSQSDSKIRWSDVLLHSAGFVANLGVSRDELCICSNVQTMEALWHEIDLHDTFKVYCSVVDTGDGIVMADAFAINSAGTLVASFLNMEFKKIKLNLFHRMLKGSAAHEEPTTKVLQQQPTSRSHQEIVPQITVCQSLNVAARTSTGTPSNCHESPDTSEQVDISKTVSSIVADVSRIKTSELVLNKTLDSLGIDSMMQIEIGFKLNDAFPQASIDHNAIANCATLKDLVTHVTVAAGESINSETETPLSDSVEGSLSGLTMTVASSQSSVCESPQVNPACLQARAEGQTPMVLFHDGSGMVGPYRKIHEQKRSVYAFCDPHIFGRKEPYQNLQAMAADYVKELIKLDLPSVILGGWSFGGIVAFEALHQLVEAGIIVEGLILIDSPYPLGHTPLPSEIIEYVSKPTSNDSATNPTIMEGFKRNTKLLADYKLTHPVATFRTVFLHSRDTLKTVANASFTYDWLCSQESRERELKQWVELLSGRVDVISIPGNHFEPFLAENIEHTSAALRSACRMLQSTK